MDKLDSDLKNLFLAVLRINSPENNLSKSKIDKEFLSIPQKTDFIMIVGEFLLSVEIKSEAYESIDVIEFVLSYRIFDSNEKKKQ